MNRYQYSVTLITEYKDRRTVKEESPITLGASDEPAADSLALRLIYQDMKKHMGYDNVDNCSYTDLRLTQKDGIKVIGYFNWCDTVCYACTESKHIDVVSFSALYSNDENEYDCSYCGHIFNEQEEEEEEEIPA